MMKMSQAPQLLFLIVSLQDNNASQKKELLRMNENECKGRTKEQEARRYKMAVDVASQIIQL